MGDRHFIRLLLDDLDNLTMMKRASLLAEKINTKLFQAFLLLGFLTGIFIGSLSASAAPSPSTANMQQNFLFALVENAQDENTPLLALWLAATHLERGEVSWMPIYPLALEEGGSPFAEAHNPIWVAPQDLAFWQTFSLLRDQGVWWDEIILIDRIGLANLTSHILSENPGHPASTWIEPQTALHQEVILIKQICEQSEAFNNPTTLEQLLLLSAESGHLHSNLTNFEFITLWDKLANRQFELSCNHPWAD